MADNQVINEMQFDVLREIGNIGSGNAATALAKMLNQKVDIKVPKAALLDFNELPQAVGGEETIVSLQFPNRLIGVVLDRFGKEADIRPMTDRVFRVRTKVVVSGQFFGWLAGIGREAVIVGPVSVREQYQNWLSDIVTVMQLTGGLPGMIDGEE